MTSRLKSACKRSICCAVSISSTHSGPRLSISIFAMASPACFTADAVLAAAAAFSTAVAESVSVAVGVTNFAAADMADVIATEVTALVRKVKVNALIRFAAGGLTRVGGGVLFFLDAAVVPATGAVETEGRDTKDDDAAAVVVVEAGSGGQQRGGGW
eukprot:TRINITY_DN13850_c0_g1_i1.p1 TRINITY_DN13850_c0_g1~~TRINITY_DN13850_c0_g1_i1.p1  ORF type:complete len:157 (-),score=29.73 TRINITY_DN13850_c0_g1_i1:678-1148(-)